MAGDFCPLLDEKGRRCILAHGHREYGVVEHIFDSKDAERCGVCSFTLAAHQEQDPAKRRFGMCERGLKVKR